MKKKLLSVLLSTAMVASLLVGCGGTAEEPAEAETTETTEATEATEEVVEEEPAEPETTEAVEVEAKFEAPSTEGWDESMKIYTYSWNDEFGSRLDMVLDAYTE